MEHGENAFVQLVMCRRLAPRNNQLGGGTSPALATCPSGVTPCPSGSLPGPQGSLPCPPGSLLCPPGSLLCPSGVTSLSPHTSMTSSRALSLRGHSSVPQGSLLVSQGVTPLSHTPPWTPSRALSPGIPPCPPGVSPCPPGVTPCPPGSPHPHRPPWSPAGPRWRSPARWGRRSRARRSRARRTGRGSWSGTRSPPPTSPCWSQTADKTWAERTQSGSASKLAWSPLLNKGAHIRFTPGKFRFSTFSPPQGCQEPSGPCARSSTAPSASSSALLPWLLKPGTGNGFYRLLQRNSKRCGSVCSPHSEMETQSAPALKHRQKWKFKL